MNAMGRRAAFAVALATAGLIAPAQVPTMSAPSLVGARAPSMVGARAPRAQTATPTVGARAPRAQTPTPDPRVDHSSAEWRSFEATVTASGRRDTLAVEDGRLAVTLRVAGSLALTRADGLGRGFRAEFLGFDDGSGTGTARAVWTDDAGDRIFSRMVGSEMQAGRQSSATITGGTGRYAGIRGTYTFTWQFVMPDEHGAVHVRVVSMKGRYRMEPPR